MVVEVHTKTNKKDLPEGGKNQQTLQRECIGGVCVVDEAAQQRGKKKKRT